MENQNTKLSYKQRLWITQCGGRLESDVMLDDKGMYVLMWSSEKQDNEKIYLPADDELEYKVTDNYQKIVEKI